MTTPAPAKDHSGVVVPPPLIYVIPLLIGWWLERRHSLPLVSDEWILLIRALGWAALAIGAVTSFSALGAFRRAGTSPVPVTPTKALVVTGVYRLSRNPMYLGLTVSYIGITCLLNTWWTVFFLPLVIIVMHVAVIAREERYLEAKFGDPYRKYREEVGRWI